MRQFVATRRCAVAQAIQLFEHRRIRVSIFNETSLKVFRLWEIQESQTHPRAFNISPARFNTVSTCMLRIHSNIVFNRKHFGRLKQGQ